MNLNMLYYSISFCVIIKRHMEKNNNNFLQSDIWREFQEAVGHKTFALKEDGFSASIIEHNLPVVGKYFYIPRGPVLCHSERAKRVEESNRLDPSTTLGMTNIINLVKKEKAGWVRIEPENNQVLELIKKSIPLPIKKAPHDMQPREIFVIDINKSEEELLAGMKSKTRYNIKLAEKHGVNIISISNLPNYLISNNPPAGGPNPNDQTSKYIEEFVRLIKLTEKRKDIKFHSANYYRKMLEVIPSDILKLYVAEYGGKVIAANLVVFFGNTVTYLHGATDDEYRNVMAPYLLQWQAIKNASGLGYKFYDFGGIKTEISNSPNYLISNQIQNPNNQIDKNTKYQIPNIKYNSWSGITKFKLGFSPTTAPAVFPGSYDIIVNESKYWKYRIFSFILGIYKKITR